MRDRAHRGVWVARHLANLARREPRRQTVGQRVNAGVVADVQRAPQELREDLCGARLAVQDGGAGVGHARQLARLLGAQQGLALRARALVERGEQAAQLPLGACVVGGVAARCRDARHRRRRGQRALDEPSRRGPQALPHARHARSEILNRHS